MQKIAHLLKKYNNTPAPKWRKQQQKMYLYEIKDQFNLTPTEVRQVEHIIEKIGLKTLHKNATSEQIILALSIFIREENTRQPIHIERYKVLKKNKITYRLYATILRNLLTYYRRRLPILIG